MKTLFLFPVIVVTGMILLTGCFSSGNLNLNGTRKVTPYGVRILFDKESGQHKLNFRMNYTYTYWLIGPPDPLWFLGEHIIKLQRKPAC